jgi:glutamine synthetase
LAKITAEYIWIDGQKPTAKLRSKTKIIDDVKSLKDIPDWGYDGSSTMQASGHFSDLQLKPAKYVPDPLHEDGAVLVLCEALNPDNSALSNTARTAARWSKIQSAGRVVGIEQEHTCFQGASADGPVTDFPRRRAVTTAASAATRFSGARRRGPHAGLHEGGTYIVGTNAGSCRRSGVPGRAIPAPDVADELWLARWLLYRVGEEFE